MDKTHKFYSPQMMHLAFPEIEQAKNGKIFYTLKKLAAPTEYSLSDKYRLGYVLSGKGTLYINSRSYPLRPGSMFCISLLNYERIVPRGELEIMYAMIPGTYMYGMIFNNSHAGNIHHLVSTCIDVDPARQQYIREIASGVEYTSGANSVADYAFAMMLVSLLLHDAK